MNTTLSRAADDLRKAPLGRGFLGFELGEQIKSLSEIRKGDVLIEVSEGRGGACVNVLVCLRTAAHPVEFGDIAYFQFLKTPFAPGGFARWHWELERTEMYRATSPNAHAKDVLALFRKHAESSDGYAFRDSLPAPERTPLAPEVVRIDDLDVRINPNLE